MKKLFSISLLFTVIILQSSIVFSQVELNLKKELGYPLVVEVSGKVPKSSKCYEYECSGDKGITLEDRVVHNGYFLGVTAIVGGKEIDFAYKVKPVAGRFKEKYSISPYQLVVGLM